MNSRLKRILDPGYRLFFVLLVLFAVVSVLTGRLALNEYYVAALEFALIVVVYLFYRRQTIRRRREIARYLEVVTVQVDNAAKESVLGFPLPVMIVRLETEEVIWCNDHFLGVSGKREMFFEEKMDSVVPGFDLRWLMEGRTECPGEVLMGKRKYTVYGSVTRSEDIAKGGRGLLATLYWIDNTELFTLRRESVLSKPVILILMVDNYDELTKNLNDGQKSGLLAAIDERVTNWASPAQCLFRRFDRDRYLLVCETRYFSAFAEARFAILDAVRELTGAESIPATLSIGVGQEADSLAEGFAYASLAIDMALSRGGDQAVVKSKVGFSFYGGHSKELEKRTKVKSRVMAHALSELMRDASMLLIMGHAGADLDSLGAAMGMVCAARTKGRPAYIVIDSDRSAAGALLARLEDVKEYAGVFVDAQEALLLADRDTLLFVVDTDRPELVESPELLQSCSRVAVIDHHRRAATYIEHAVLSFHEPYASSTCELVTELLQYMSEPGQLLRVEADALLAGIVLDTKNFTMHTGARTFEAAAFLRGAGADTTAVKRLFQVDLQSNFARHGIISQVHMFRDAVAIAPIENTVDRVVAAQAADEMLSIAGVQASFVLFPADASGINISARSLGAINVQVIMEKLGGGGHQTMAGAQIKDGTVPEVYEALCRAVDEYFEECGI